jgi:hypothetical protein
MTPSIAEVMMADSAACGVYRNSGVRRRSVAATASAMTALDAAVRHPASRFTADREKGDAVR